MTPKERLYTTEQAANAVGISRVTLQAWIRAGKIRAPQLRSRPWNPPARLWTASDVARLHAFKKKIHRRASRPGRGRKPKKSARNR